jgi:hypothetical protein
VKKRVAPSVRKQRPLARRRGKPEVTGMVPDDLNVDLVMRVATALLSAADEVELRDVAEIACEICRACRVPPYLFGSSFRTRVLAAAALFRHGDCATATQRALMLEQFCREEIQAGEQASSKGLLRAKFQRLKRNPRTFLRRAIMLLTGQKHWNRAEDYFTRFLNRGHVLPLTPAAPGKLVQMSEGDPAFPRAYAVWKGLECNTISFNTFSQLLTEFADFWPRHSKKRSKAREIKVKKKAS